VIAMHAHSPFVLVHGALQSAATWDLVAPRLRQSGRPVIVATLTGLEGEGSGLTETVTLDTHVSDVVALLEREDLHDVVLVGHSYAGMIITGVAEHARPRIGHLVYVDALVPEHGQAALDLLPDATRNAFRTLAEKAGGWRIPANDAFLDLWGLEEGPAREFVKARMCDFTIRCFEQPVEAPTDAAGTLPRTYIASVKGNYPAKAVFDRFAARARREGWFYHELPTGHDCQAEMPDALSELLLKATVNRRSLELSGG
jgi:pimeloyl-ACP methyl ester carboxylesterase